MQAYIIWLLKEGNLFIRSLLVLFLCRCSIVRSSIRPFRGRRFLSAQSKAETRVQIPSAAYFKGFAPAVFSAGGFEPLGSSRKFARIMIIVRISGNLASFACPSNPVSGAFFS